MSDNSGNMPLSTKCPVCRGSGRRAGERTPIERCPRCSGTGRAFRAQVCCGLVRQTENGYRAFCNACGWEGAERSDADVVAADAMGHGA